MSNKIICNVCKGAKVYQISNLEFEECSKCKGKGFIKMTTDIKYRMMYKFETKIFNNILDLEKYVLKNKIYNFEIDIIKG